jgi:CheY-like chemotaxis protein/anti-sigma regulatory factor (Ser/Thr protein kinase)
MTLSEGRPPTVAQTGRGLDTSAEPSTILVVDDYLIDRRIAEKILSDLGGWMVRFAANGVEALESLKREVPRVVLTDLQMPEMDGLVLVQKICELYPQVPIILMTRAGSEEVAVQALRAGASNYVPKRNLRTHLPRILEQVLAASSSEQTGARMLRCLTKRESFFNLENDPELVPPLIALLQEDLRAMSVCDGAGVTQVGVALEEALLNAIYHGNLEVGAALHKVDENKLKQLVEQRLAIPSYRNRGLRLFASVTKNEARYVVIDQGPGFDSSRLPDPADSANMDKSNGRGIVLMQMFMDKVTYSAGGTQVTLEKKRPR